MRLTRQTNYAIRILMYCAANEGRLSRIPEIAAAYSVSELFLFKILQPLVEAGLVQTVRGRNGGVRLGNGEGEGAIALYSSMSMQIVASSPTGFSRYLGSARTTKRAPRKPERPFGCRARLLNACLTQRDQHSPPMLCAEPLRATDLSERTSCGTCPRDRRYRRSSACPCRTDGSWSRLRSAGHGPTWSG